MNAFYKHFDGWLYVAMAVCGAVVAGFQTDEAAKLLSPSTCYWVKLLFGIIGAGALAGKTYRSTAFGDQKNKDISTTSVVKTTETKQTSVEEPTDKKDETK